MPKSTRTKCMIAKGVKKLLETVSFGELSVGEICKQCQISRNTFYYHFKDIYDLVEWACLEESRKALQEKRPMIPGRKDFFRFLKQSMKTNLSL